MKKPVLQNLTLAELLEHFAMIGVEEDKAIFDDDNAKFTRLFSEMDAVEKELKKGQVISVESF